MSHVIGFFDSFPFLIGVLVLLLLYVLQTPILTFPVYFLMLYSGVIYGWWLGSIINMVGMWFTTNGGYYLGYAGKAERLLDHEAMKKFVSWLNRNGMRSIIFLRIVPIIPYNVVSIGSGLLKIERRDYHVVNSLAVIPYPIMWGIVGDILGMNLLQRLHFELDYRLIVPSIAIVFLVGFAYLVIRNRLVQNQSLEDEVAI